MKRRFLQILICIEAILFCVHSPLFAQSTRSTTGPTTRPAYTPPPRPIYTPRPRKVYPSRAIINRISKPQDITAQLIAAKDNTAILITAPVAVSVHGSPVITAKNFAIIGVPGSKLVAASAGTALIARGEGFECDNVDVSGPPAICFFRLQAPQAHLYNCWTASNVDYLAILDGPNESNVSPGGAADALIENCGQKVPTLADTIYCNGASRPIIRNIKILHTVGEQGIRFDKDRGGHPTDDWLIEGGTIISNSGIDKSCVSNREGWGVIRWTACYGYLRDGQASGDPTHAMMSVIGCSFFRDSTGINNISILSGIVWVNGNTFYLPPEQRAIGYQQGTGILASADQNIKISVPTGAAMKPLALATEWTPRGDVYHESNGTNTISK